MKLIDILARDLEAWPDSPNGGETKAVSQDSGGELNSLDSMCTASVEQMMEDSWSYRYWSFAGIRLEEAEDFRTAIVTRSQWQAAVDALKAEEQSVQSIDWSKAPEGATHFDPVDCNYLRQFGTIAQCWYKSSDSWTCKGWQYPDDLSTMGRLIKRPVWSGEGLPPAGLLVENNLHGLVMVLAHGIFRGGDVVICQGDDTIITCTPDTLSPIRTAEQIADDERKQQIIEMIDSFGLDTAIWGRDAVMEICGHLWEKGYRKQEVQQ